MTRSRSISPVTVSLSLHQPAGCPRKSSRLVLLLLLLGLLSGCPAARAQPAAGVKGSHTVVDTVAAGAATITNTTIKPESNWTTIWAVLGGVAIGALGVWLWTRRAAGQTKMESAVSERTPQIPVEPLPKKTAAQNVYKSPPTASASTAKPTTPDTSAPTAADTTGKGVSFQSMREVQGTNPKPSNRQPGKDKKPKQNVNSRSPSADKNSDAWPPIATRASTMNPTTPTPPTGDDKPLEPGQTVEWPAPTSTPSAIQELLEASAPAETPAPAGAPETATPVASNGPVHYYAPAPDVPSIEHRKLSPNPLPQMPLLITLPHAEASTAQFSFSPQADQSRIIGNGVRELKEFFSFELPPTEQFTTIKNLTSGKLEKRDDAWHVVQKAEIALS